jgi:pimeloyl-ACP methyl ester carboxylesterase
VNKIVKIALVATLLAYATYSTASFKQREQRWANQILDSQMIGEAVWLTVKADKFLALYNPAGKPKGGVILMHDAGLNPDWPDVISPLRRELPEHGWTTLSLQMPVLPQNAPLTAFSPIMDETPQRIRAGIEFLRGKGIRRIVLIGHDMGAAMGTVFLASEPKHGVAGFVGIAMNAPVLGSTLNTLDPRLYTPNALAKLTLPILDIYGGQDAKTVTGSAPERLAAAEKAGNKDYEQEQLPEANHFFMNHDQALVERVAKWLERFEKTQ